MPAPNLIQCLPTRCRITADICSPRPRSPAIFLVLHHDTRISYARQLGESWRYAHQAASAGRSSYPALYEAEGPDGTASSPVGMPPRVGYQGRIRVRDATYPGGCRGLICQQVSAMVPLQGIDWALHTSPSRFRTCV